MSDKYILQATREEDSILTFHLIPPLTDWHPEKYAGMLADLVTHISAYTKMPEETFVKLMLADLDRRNAILAALDPLKKPA